MGLQYQEKLLNDVEELSFFNKVLKSTKTVTCTLNPTEVVYALASSERCPGIVARRKSGMVEDTYTAKAYDSEGTLFCFEQETRAKEIFEHLRFTYAEANEDTLDKREDEGLQRARAFLNAEPED